MILSDNQRKIISEANSVIICQAENPDGDSVGSALALEEILSDMGKDVYCIALFRSQPIYTIYPVGTALVGLCYYGRYRNHC